MQALSSPLSWLSLGISEEQLLRLPDSNKALKCEDLIMLVNYIVHKAQCVKLKIETIYSFISVCFPTVCIVFYIV